MVEPARFTQALRTWAGDGPRRALRGGGGGDLPRLPRPGSRPPGWPTPSCSPGTRSTRCASIPPRWGATPVFVYGFDDFDALQLDALDTLAQQLRRGRRGVAALRGRAGRRSRRSRTSTRSCSRAAPTSASLPPLDDHYAPEARAALHHVERSLFEDEVDRSWTPARRSSSTPPPASAPRSSWPARALLDLLRDGVEPGDIAVVLRRPDDYASLLEQVFGAYDIPFSIDRSVPLGHTGLGRGLLALVRCAVDPDAPAEDLLAWLRTPGLLRQPGLADRLEAQVRRAGAHTRRRGARAVGDASTGSSTTSTGCARPAAALPCWPSWSASWSACSPLPTARQAAILRGPELDDPRVFVAARDALAAAARRASRRTRARGSSPSACSRCCASCACTSASRRSPTACRSPSPRRSARAASRPCSCAGCRRASSPRGAAPEPFLPDEDRRAIARASGLTLPVREDRLDRERYLFYLCCSRAERLLVLSSRSQRRGGQPRSRSRSSSRTCATCSAPGAAESHALAVGRHLARRGRAHRGRAGAGAGGDRPAPHEDAAGAADRRRRAGAAGRARRRLGRRARELRRLPGQVAGAERAAARGARARPGADGARALRPRGPPGARSSACARRPATAASRPPTSTRAERLLLEALRGQQLRVPAVARSRRACRPRRAGSSSTCSASCAARPTATAASSPSTSSCRSARRRRRAGRDRARPAGARPDRPRRH